MSCQFCRCIPSHDWLLARSELSACVEDHKRTKETRSARRRTNMSCPDRLSQWSQQVSIAFAHLSKPQVWGLVLWSAGIALSGTAGITQISALLALVLEQQEQTVFQRLREWYLDAKHKSGKKRRELDVTSCFAPLLRWIVRLWGNGNRQMVLVLDATTLGERWTILSISVVVCKCAIPVAWKVLGGHEKGAFRPHWEGLLEHLEGSIPADWQVLVMADRGLYARWLFQVIIDCGWHPFLRIWIETGFKDFKRGLWGWHHSKMVEASCVERLWLAMAVAQLWTVSVGCQAEEEQRQKPLGESLPVKHIARRRRKRPAGQPPERRLSCVVRGRLGLVAPLFTAEILPGGRLLPEP